MSRFRLVVVLLGLAVLVGAVSLAARGGVYTATTGPEPVPVTTAPEFTLVPPTAAADAERERIEQQNEQLGDIPALQVATVFYILVVVVILAIGVTFVVGYLRDGGRWRSRRTGPLARPDLSEPGTAPALARAVDEAVLVVEQGEAREAVIACWLLLGRAAAAAGTPARPAETAGEYAARLAEEHVLSEAALVRLADLYREARFSSHPVDDGLRRAARRALGILQAELGSGVRL